MLTHTHPDHLDGLAALRAATGAPVSAWHAPEVPTVLDGALLVACGTGALRLVRVQRPGRAPMDADALLRGFAVPAGTRLG